MAVDYQLVGGGQNLVVSIAVTRDLQKAGPAGEQGSVFRPARLLNRSTDLHIFEIRHQASSSRGGTFAVTELGTRADGTSSVDRR